MTELAIAEAPDRISNRALQEAILRFTTDAARRYAKRNGVCARESHLQETVAAKLMDLGFVVATEPNRSDYKAWFHEPVDYSGGFKVDLLVFDPDKSCRADRAKLRAIVEFKNATIWNVGDDITKVQSLLRGFSAPVFGLVVSHSACERPGLLDAEITEAHRLAEERGLAPPIISEPFNDPVDDWHHNGVTIGLTV